MFLSVTGFLVFATSGGAQGISTTALTGLVRSTGGEEIDGAQVEVSHRGTGYSLRTTTRRGRFVVAGLEVGGPYAVTVRRLGFAAKTRDSVFLSVGEPRSLDFVLELVAQSIDGVTVAAEATVARSAQTGVTTAISDSLLHRLPTLNRDMYDFVRLVPQVSTRFNGLAGGVGIRLNSYLIDGVSDRQLGSNSVMGGARGGKTMPLDAVKEYQVLLTPYDARYGDFAGLLVNAVTKSGTNEFHGSAFGYLRNETLARSTGFLGGSSYERRQYGLTLGGPFIRNRAHFFLAPEFQDDAEPAAGPYIGQGPDAPVPVPVSTAAVDSFVSILRARGFDAGHGGRVTSINPVTAFFGRVDISIPEWRSRLALRHTYSDVARTQFARSNTSRFALSSSSFAIQFTKRSTALQLFTQPAATVFNELLVAHSTIPNGAARYAYAPTVSVMVPSMTGPGTATLVAGPPDMGQGTRIINTSVEVADHLGVHLGEHHALSLGVRSEWFHYYGNMIPGSYGRWTFSSLDSLARGQAALYAVSKDFGAASTPLNGVQIGVYINDEWRASEQLMITAGLRADILSYDAEPQYNAAIDSVFGRRTTDFPGTAVHWSPRVGLSWEPTADGRTRIRGGFGLFAGRPPLGWLRSPLRQNGTGIRRLSCAGPGSNVVPELSLDPGAQPNACANGKSFSSGGVDLVDRRLRMAETFRASIAVDRELPWDVVATAEGMYTRNRSDFVLVNMNLRGPQGVDRHGRVMYGTLDQLGARPALVVPDTLPEVIDLRNQSRNYSWSITGQLTKRFSNRIEARGSYTHSVMRDVQSLMGNSAGNAVIDDWAGFRAIAGQHDNLKPGISSFDMPHRVVLAATYVAPWKRWTTDVSFSYIGESGMRFTYLDSSVAQPGLTGAGDLNADGSNANDPIYVPRNAADTAEILFDATNLQQQQEGFERFIQGSPCLRNQRGRIVERNSCVAPWVHTTQLSVRQGLPPVSGHRLTLQLDVFNVFNLLNSDWGLVHMPVVNVLQHVRQTPGGAGSSRSVFRFNPSLKAYNTANTESNYQLQLALRYEF